MVIHRVTVKENLSAPQVVPKPRFNLFQVCWMVDETEEGPCPPQKVQIVGLELNPSHAHVQGWWYSISAVEGRLNPWLKQDYRDWVHEHNLMSA